MKELYVGEPVVVNNESVNFERLVYHEALGPLFDGTLGHPNAVSRRDRRGRSRGNGGGDPR